MKPLIESYVVCEGYHDRAFWGGLLRYLKCKDLKPSRSQVTYDPWSEQVRGGQYGYVATLSDTFIRVVPSGGKSRIPDVIKNRLRGASTKKLSRLVVNVDSDTYADGSPPETQFTADSLLTIVREFDRAAEKNSDGDILAFDMEVTISPIWWEANDSPTEGVPNQNTLERIICASLREVYPTRGVAVHNWLKNRPDPPGIPSSEPKEYAWSYLAGWHASDMGGYEAFCGLLWKETEIVQSMKKRLEASRSWRVLQSLAI